jgi:hypothetical protein
MKISCIQTIKTNKKEILYFYKHLATGLSLH